MTPEEWFRSLNDRRYWNGDELAPRGVPRRVVPWRPIVAGVAVAIVAVLVIVGTIQLRDSRQQHPVAPTPLPSQTAQVTLEPSPTPTSSSTVPFVGNGAVPPAVQFDDDCSNVLSETEASAILGAGATLEDSSAPFLSRRGVEDAAFARRENAGLFCQWTVARYLDGQRVYGSDDQTIVLLIVPEAAVPAIAETSCGKGIGEAYVSSGFCRIEHVAHGFRISGGVRSSSAAASRAAASVVITRFDRVSAGVPVVPRSTGNGEWPALYSCDDLGATLDLAGLAGDGATFGTTGLGAGRAGNLVQEALDWDMGLWTSCGVQFGALDANSAGEFGTIGIYEGGAWLADRVAARGAFSVTLPGFESAALTKDGVLFVFRGPNALTLQSYGAFDPMLAGPLLSALADELDSRAE